MGGGSAPFLKGLPWHLGDPLPVWSLLMVGLNTSESGFKRMEIVEASDDESEEHLHTNLKMMHS